MLGWCVSFEFVVFPWLFTLWRYISLSQSLARTPIIDHHLYHFFPHFIALSVLHPRLFSLHRCTLLSCFSTNYYTVSSNYYTISTFNQFPSHNIMAQTTHVQIGDGNTNSGNIIGSFNKTVYKSAEDTQIMRWLSPLEPNNRHQGVRTDRFHGVGDWLLEEKEFRDWRSGEGGADKAVLFCSGNPGVGKTYLR